MATSNRWRQHRFRAAQLTTYIVSLWECIVIASFVAFVCLLLALFVCFVFVFVLRFCLVLAKVYS